ncbi:hypothetical protein JOF56_011603 [Kibdelosporangium banguiense]|uniref:Siphovirus-type tail component C-terminal domain-containing protein n=1 Tax=Kibdelosporangium banguiense TaxID=1365924 RepID=A0ABS4U3I1_9PSEU|nr:phage tail domain-containing protein [Kibdelosporangium banguiense]MBP2331218.1 hypothetical protein [Kibdelosporangium banguiense]
MARELIWYGGDGWTQVLNDRPTGYRVHEGVTGLGAPPRQLVADTSPLVDGEVITDEWDMARTIMLPMTVWGPDNETFLARMRALALSLSAPGELELGQADGRRRRIRAHYAGGLEGDEAKDLGGDTTWARFVLSLRCPDAYWFDPTPVTQLWQHSGSAAFLGDPFFPLRIGSSQVLGDTTTTNPGDVISWPTWEITPPGSGLVLKNRDTLEELEVSGSIPAGRTLKIVTEPGKQEVSLSDETDWWDHLEGVPVFWPIQRGVNNISVTLTGASTGSSVSLSYNPRYKTAW